jgi:hypothetical protein
MNYFFEVDSVNNVFRVTWEGPVTDDVMLKSAAEARAFLASHPGIRSIGDFSKVREFEVSAEIVRRLADDPSCGEERSEVVFVAPADIVFGMVRMFIMLTEESRPNRHVVRTMKEAYALFRVVAPQFSRLDLA